MNDLLNDLENEMITDKLISDIDGLTFILENWKIENINESIKNVSDILNLKIKDIGKQETGLKMQKLLLYSLFASTETLDEKVKWSNDKKQFYIRLGIILITEIYNI